MAKSDHGILMMQCPDRPGVVASISGFLYKHGSDIIRADELRDPDTDTYFMRIEWDLDGFRLPLADFARDFHLIANEFAMLWRVARSSDRPRVAILVSRSGHCLADLLYRHQIGELPCEIKLVIVNHDDLRKLTEFYGITFELVHEGSKEHVEETMLRLLEGGEKYLVVLARYMQILSDDFVARYAWRMINVHHSFLPAFVGAKPYRRSYERGVKLIGATSHYVTAQLDEGPIVEKDVVRVDHRDSLPSIIRKGGDVERAVLMRAVRWHVEKRIIVRGNKTVVFA